MNFPVGAIVPSGYYDNDRAIWVASENGQVIQVVGVTGGRPTWMWTGTARPTGRAALAALGITAAEQQALAPLYQPGQSLWRMPLSHFSTYDFNPSYGQRLVANAIAPPNPAPQFYQPPDKPDLLCLDHRRAGPDPGRVDRVGRYPMDLVYGATRAPGRKEAYTLKFPVTGPMPCPRASSGHGGDTLSRAIGITGRCRRRADQDHVHIWDGRDAYGREVQGTVPVTVRSVTITSSRTGRPAARSTASA